MKKKTILQGVKEKGTKLKRIRVDDEELELIK